MAVVALFVLVGITLGLLGGGGSILTVPLLVYVAGLEAKSAIAMSLLVVGLTSVFGLVPHARRGNIDYKVAAVFGPVAMAGAFAGGEVARYFSNTALLLLFAVMMVATSLAMLRRRAQKQAKTAPRSPAVRGLLLALEGAGVGMFTGLVGAGGGFMVVPALVLLARLEMRRAIGTSLLIIALKSFAGLAGHLSHESIDWTLGFTLAAAAGVGAVAGAALASKVPAGSLRRGFGVFVLAMGVFVLGAQLPAPVLAKVWDNAAWALGGVLLLAATGLGWWTVSRLRRQSRRAELTASLLSVPPPAPATASSK